MNTISILYLSSQTEADYSAADSEEAISIHQEALPLFSNHTVVLVPGEKVSMQHLSLPELSANKLKKLLPFALEEKVLDKIENLSFYLLPQRLHNGETAVAIITRQHLNEYVDRLKQLHCNSHHLYPNYFALPVPAKNSWNILMWQNEALLRTEKNFGCAVPLTQFFVLLPALMEELGKPEKLHIYYAADTLKKQAETVSSDCAITIELVNPWNLFKQGLAQLPELNLYQSVVTKQAELLPSWLWKACRYNLFSLILIGTLCVSVQSAFLYYENKGLEKKINALYSQVFPLGNSVEDPKISIEQALSYAQNEAQGGPFLATLGHIGTALKKTKYSVNLQSLHYDQDQLMLKVSANNFAELSAFVTALRQQSLLVKQNDAHTEQEQVLAKLEIRVLK